MKLEEAKLKGEKLRHTLEQVGGGTVNEGNSVRSKASEWDRSGVKEDGSVRLRLKQAGVVKGRAQSEVCVKINRSYANLI